MPERTRTTRVVAALSAGLLAALLVGPVALAQTDEVPRSEELDPGQQQPPQTPEQPSPEQPEQPEQHPPGSWGASTFESPFDTDGAELRQETFDVEGTLSYQKTGPSDFIEEVEVRIVDDPGDSFSPSDVCPLPSPTTFSGDGPEPGLAAEHRFEVADVTLACNGRYLVEAQGWLDDPDAESSTYTLRTSFVLAAMPASVTGLGVTLDSEDRSVTATFEPLADDQLALDAVGYVLERSGPGGGTFVDVATIGLDDAPEFVDPLDDAPGGAYTYRVRAIRAGADGEVRSSIVDTETDTVALEGAPGSSSTSSPRSSGGRSTVGSRSLGGRISTGSAPRLTTPTTLDTGFEDSLDYGERGEGELAGDEPVAGQSIVRDEADGMGLAVPAAGALVMLGWAGHLLYLNRLAKQL